MAKLLMLKEYLELDDDGVTTIRSLLDAELSRESAMRNAVRGAAAANGNALCKFAAAIEAVKARCLPSSSRPERATFSWKKKKDKKTKQRLTNEYENPFAAVGWQSLRFTSPVISSRQSNRSYAASPAPYYLQVTSSTGEERKEHSPPLSSSSQPSANEEATSITATLSPATEFDPRELDDKKSNDNDDDDDDDNDIEMSLVSMIDYMNKNDCVVAEEEEEGDEEESFYRSLDNIERTTEQLLHRIRRFEMLAELDSPMECCSPSSHAEEEEEEEEEEEGRAWELLRRLKAIAPRGGGEKLLLDFFIQGGKADGGLLPMKQRRTQGATATTTEMLRTARRWIDGSPGGEGKEDCGDGEAAALREMERNGRWRCFHEEEDELALRFGDAMLQLLVEELVKELASQL